MSRFHQNAFAKPENALKRAEELILVGQQSPALRVLHEVITSKRHRTWQKSLEDVMFKYVELCVDMRRGRFAKEGLIQYRIICQHVNVGSLEEVVKHFIKLSTDRADAAIAAAKQVTDATDLRDIADLEDEGSPEDLVLQMVTGDGDKERTDRELVAPCFKFLWETYRTVLEILRNNNKLEALYAMTAIRAFNFCLSYKRTTEFRRLCEILRNHLQNLNKYRDQRDRPELTQSETLQLYLETRFEQLKVATELELWQEGFRSVEDIHGLMVFARKTPKPQMMSVFYAKLTKIFWMSDNYLYHAIVWLKLFQLSLTHNKALSNEDVSNMASAVVLSALCILPYEGSSGLSYGEQGLEKERHIRIANLLGFQGQYYAGMQEGTSKVGGTAGSVGRHDHTDTPLTRDALLAEVAARGVLSYVPEAVRSLYMELEEEVSPLDLASRVEPLLEQVAQHAEGVAGPTGSLENMTSASPVPHVPFAQFVTPVRTVSSLKQLHALGSVYQTMRIPFLRECIPNVAPIELERIMIDGVKHGYIAFKMDHRTESVTCTAGASLDGNSRMQVQLSVLSKRLNDAVGLLPDSKRKRAADHEARVANAVRAAMAAMAEEHSRVLARKVIIERRKEDQERQMMEEEKEEEARKLKAVQEREEEERRRQEAEARRRAEERIRREIEEQEAAEAAELLKEREKQMAKEGKKATKLKAQEGEMLSKQQIMQEQLSEQIKTRQELEKKLERTSRTMDYLERAKREEEKTLLEEALKQRLKEDEQYHDEQQAVAAEQHRATWEADVKVAREIEKLMADKEAFAQLLGERRLAEYNAQKQAQAERVAEKKALRHAEIIRLRKKAYLERLRRAEARAAEEARRAEEEERRAKLEEQAERQRERERELEGKRGGDGGGGGRFVPPFRREGGEGRRAPSPPRGTGGSWGGDGGGDRGGGDRGGGAYRPPVRTNGGFGDDRRGGYGDDRRGGYGDDRRGGYGDDRRGGFGDDRRGGYGDDRRGGYGDDRRGGYGDDRAGGGGGGGYRPPGARDDRGGGGYRPPGARDDRGGGGGGYRPPGAR